MTGFADDWDPDRAVQFGTQWVERKYLADSLIDVDDLVTVVDSLLRHGGSLSLHSVTVAPRRTVGLAHLPDLADVAPAAVDGHDGRGPIRTGRSAWWGEALVAESDACL